MKKTLLVTAVAASMAATAAQAATVYEQDGAKVDLYGNIQMAYTSATDGNGDSSAALNDNGTTLGISAEREINDLVAYLKLEMDDFEADEMSTDTRGDDAGDQAYVGLKGGFGDIRLGSYGNLYDGLIQGPVDGAWYAGVSGNKMSGDDDQIRYTSPSFSGFQFMVASNVKGDAEQASNAPDTNSIVAGAKYSMDALTLAVAYDDLGNTPDEGDSIGLTGTYALTSTLNLAAKAEQFSAGTASSDNDKTQIAFKASHNYGSGSVYGALQSVSEDGADDRTEVTAGATYALSPAVIYFVETTMYDQANDEGDFVSTGLYYAF